MILLTGGSGFVGRAVLKSLSAHHPVRSANRQMTISEALPYGVDFFQSSLSPNQNWFPALLGVSSVIHCAARVHVMNELAVDPLHEFRLVNVDGTLNLAKQASKAGVRRFIFISSIKVNGECTEYGYPFTADQVPAPCDPYGVSKWEAELALRALSKETGMEVVIIRAPLVYGPGVKANFRTMMQWVQRGLPLPFGGVTKNQRSFVFLDNLVDLIISCVDHPAAANQTFLVSDGKDLSTAALLKGMASALGKTSNLISVPPLLIALGAKLIGRADVAKRLCNSLQVDICKTKELLGWSPLIGPYEGFRRTAQHFLETQD